MSAVLAIEPTTGVFVSRIDGHYTVPCNDHGWQLRFGYRIQMRATPGHVWNGRDGAERDEGISHDVSIVEIFLLNEAANKSVQLARGMLPADDLAAYEGEIAEKLDAGDLP